jgi:F-type H+-transporting ATPase subunit delta
VASDDPVVLAYARAIFEVAEAEDALSRVEDDLFQFARAIETNPELRDRLGDPGVDIAAKLEVIDELLGSHPQTASAVMWLVQSGRTRQLTDVADAFVQLAAQARERSVAEVRSAVSLTDDQERQLARALGQATGQAVDVKVIVDESVVGGIIVRMGDTVIDGSVSRRLSELRASLTGA